MALTNQQKLRILKRMENFVNYSRDAQQDMQNLNNFIQSLQSDTPEKVVLSLSYNNNAKNLTMNLPLGKARDLIIFVRDFVDIRRSYLSDRIERMVSFLDDQNLE